MLRLSRPAKVVLGVIVAVVLLFLLRLGRPGRLEAAWPPPDAGERGISKGELISHQGMGNYVRFAVDDDALVVFAVAVVTDV